MLREKNDTMGKLKEHFIDELSQTNDLADDSYYFELWKESEARKAFVGTAFLARQEAEKIKLIEKIETCQTKN